MDSPPEARCQCCERKLTDPVSRARGYGPVCYANLHPAPVLAPARPAGDVPGQQALLELELEEAARG